MSAPVATSKKVVATPKKAASAKPKKPAAHPKYTEMIAAAVGSLKERGGSSRQAILKYIVKNFNVGKDERVVNQHLKMALRAGVKNGALKQSKGSGASGSFRLGDKAAPKKVVAKKPKAAGTAVKKVAKKAKTPKKAAKKVKTPKKAAKPKSLAKAKKPKTAVKAKKPAAKKAKTPVKAKKAAGKPKKAATKKA